MKFKVVKLMRILVTNDDGIHAPGILALAKKMSELGMVKIMAPLEEKSAIGHGITIREPICVETINLAGIGQAWGVKGTPADCVKLGLTEILTEGCDLVVSGINNGPNLGTDVLYSGTVSAAMEGAIFGIPAIAVSLAAWNHDDYSVAAEIAFKLIGYLKENRLTIPKRSVLNINVPAVSREEIKGIRVTVLGKRDYNDRFEKRFDPRGNPYYWAVGDILPFRKDDLIYDIFAVEKNYVSLTPLHYDLTNYQLYTEIRDWGLENC